jgi:hypothetical protein
VGLLLSRYRVQATWLNRQFQELGSRTVVEDRVGIPKGASCVLEYRGLECDMVVRGHVWVRVACSDMLANEARRLVWRFRPS